MTLILTFAQEELEKARKDLKPGADCLAAFQQATGLTQHRLLNKLKA